MKTYSFTYQGKPYRLTGLHQDAKDEILDPIRGTLLDRADRLLAKKLINGVKHAQMTQMAMGAGLHSASMIDELMLPENHKRLIGALLEPKELATEQFVDELYQEQATNRTSSLSKALRLVLADAYPQKAQEILAGGGDGGEEGGDPKAPAATTPPNS